MTRWTTEPYSVAAARALSEELGLSSTAAAILVRRGFADPGAARSFLSAEDDHDPGLFEDMGPACEGILRHVASGARIVVHGDYDVDGVCSTAVLLRALRRLGAEPSWHLPSRFDGGYGLNRRTIDELAAAGTGLLITVDCGVTAEEEATYALEHGLDVVITDHHRPGETLPGCPVIHPGLGGYPFADLCAAGVAHKLARGLFAAAGHDPAEADEDLDLVGLATVADVVPLLGENRRLVRAGLRAMSRTKKPGLRALMKIAHVDIGRVDEQSLGFRLGPRMNAAGRIGRPDAALELVMTDDDARAGEVAEELDAANRERRDTETRISFAAEALCAEQDAQAAYVLAGEGWHPGVIGIVASRMVERHNRPCVMISLDGESGRGSGRSVAAYDLHAGLGACSEHLVRFGGHRAAAGFDIEAARVDEFRRAFARHAAGELAPEDLIPVQEVDALVPCTDVGLPLAEELAKLGPFGHGNRSPVLLLPAARVEDVRGMGEDNQHARLTVASGGARARAVAFRTSPGSLKKLAGEPHDIAVRLEVNEWNGAVEPRLDIRAVCPTVAGGIEVLGEDEPWEEGFARAWEGGELDTVDPAALGERVVVDRRGDGFAGVCGDLLASGESVLVLVADTSRRREAVGSLLGRIAGPLCLASWAQLAAEPPLAAGYVHLAALDPPPEPWMSAAEQAPGPEGAALHRAWGPVEVEFAAKVAQATLDLREPLKDVYRALSADEGLQRALEGASAHRRSVALCARLLRVLCELDLVSYEAGALRLLDAAHTDLARSSTYASCRDRLRSVRLPAIAA
ncbi:MAG: single-stranded-DNA-specific exonuclease RecJ [Thermoleophilaceae bacterium]|nr:single-stranded-DNA-specific exonuclease RecJ [Thermoleophilaceae bacterium]